MISKDDFDAYSRAVEAIAAEAEEAVAGSVLEWCRGHPEATVAECRSYAIRCMEGMVQAYDDAAATLAARWYDGVAEDEGASLRPAITSVTYSGKLVADTARYQARKLAAGDVEGFAASCGELARNDALRSVNQTVIANCGRDRREGVRFARVPTGLETCTFCLMLASRGAVYHTRESAGEFSHYHRRCDCKVVPGFADDPMAELVEGHSPREARDRYQAFREIDGNPALNAKERESAKRSILGISGPEIVYLKPREDFAKERGGDNDLAAHKALMNAGYEVVVRKEDAPEGFSNIDLMLDSRLCELKSPTSDASGANGLRFIERNIRKAIKQFASTYGGPTRPIIVVVNCETVPVARADAIKRASLEMERHNVDRVLLITSGGIVDDLKSKPQGC